ncbi:MAG: dimethylargininase, partial [Anaerolineae bacterium]|nr:dimethylargininase [Anaerolineae bacterium]
LIAYRDLAFIRPPGTLDGGDVLRLDRRLYIGVGGRSNHEGVQQLTKIVSPYGYTVYPVSVRGCLHLKSAVTQIADELLLMNPEWIDPLLFDGYNHLDVDEREIYAGNALYVAHNVIYPKSYPRTMDRIAAAGISISPVDMSEFIKAEGAVTCCSLLIHGSI